MSEKVVRVDEVWDGCPLAAIIANAVRLGRLETLSRLTFIFCEGCGDVIRGENLVPAGEGVVKVENWPAECDGSNQLEIGKFNNLRSQPGAEGREWDEGVY